MVECTKCGERKHYAKGLCKRCYKKQYRAEHRAQIKTYRAQYNAEHRAQIKTYNAQRHAAHGGKTMCANRDCALFLGVHVAERVLSKVFKDVKKMPMHNHGYDFICNRGMKIDVKSSTMRIRMRYADSWAFNITRNTVADYFLCIAFDNRDDLTPMHIWLLPGDLVNDHTGITISTTNIDKWDEYRINIDEVVACCEKIKNG